MLIRIIPMIILFTSCTTIGHERIATVTPITAEMEVEWLPAATVIPVIAEAEFEYIPE